MISEKQWTEVLMKTTLIFLIQYLFKREVLLNVKFLELFKKIKSSITIFLLTALTTQAFELSEEVLQAEQAVYRVTTTRSYGTGFFIAPDLFVTNFHVIDEIQSPDEISLDRQDRPSIGIRNITAVSLFADLAILQTEVESPVYLSEGELSSLDENLVIIGHANGAERAKIIRSTGASSLWEDVFYETPTDFSGKSFGLSGSPLINLDGDFLGVVGKSIDNFKTSTISQYVSQLLEGHIGTLCESFECIDQEIKKIQELVSHQLRRGVLESEPTLFHYTLKELRTFLNVEKSVSYLLLGGEEGSAIALYQLGNSYSNGQNGVEQDLTKAAELYQQAANLGHTIAIYNLGVFYSKGKGIPQDLTKAAELYRQAAEQGDAYAQNNWGINLFEGKGVEQDIPQAVVWLTKAAEQGHANSQKVLFILYTHGVGVEKNVEMAAYWLAQSESSQQ